VRTVCVAKTYTLAPADMLKSGGYKRKRITQLTITLHLFWR